MPDTPSGEQLAAAFARWAADERVSASALERSRQRRMSEAAASSASWQGMLVDITESRRPVTLAVGARRLQGTVVAVGPDFCVLEPDSAAAPATIVALGAIGALWHGPPAAGTAPAPGTAPAGDRKPPLRLSLAAALAVLAEERTPVALWGGETRIDGDLLAVGADVVTVRSGAPTRRIVHLPLGGISVCELR